MSYIPLILTLVPALPAGPVSSFTLRKLRITDWKNKHLMYILYEKVVDFAASHISLQGDVSPLQKQYDFWSTSLDGIFIYWMVDVKKCRLGEVLGGIFGSQIDHLFPIQEVEKCGVCEVWQRPLLKHGVPQNRFEDFGTAKF